MTKNFFEYVKELVPEKGSVFFTLENHTPQNNISLYNVANLLCGEKVLEPSYSFFDPSKIKEITAYSWNTPCTYVYKYPIMGLMFLYEDGEEMWIHFSKHAFIGAICIVAIRNDIEFDDPYYEEIRQAWARKINEEEAQPKDKFYTNLETEELNFDETNYREKLFFMNLGQLESSYTEDEKAELKEYWKTFDDEH